MNNTKLSAIERLKSVPDIENGNLKIYGCKDAIYVLALDRNNRMFFNVYSYDNIIRVSCDGDSMMSIHLNDKVVNYCTSKGCASNVVELVLYVILLNKRSDDRSNSMTKISDTLEKFVENVGVSIGSNDYNEAKSHFENNTK